MENRIALPNYPKITLYMQVILRIALVFIFGDDRPGRDETETFHQHVVNVFKGMASVPLNIPATPYGKAIKVSLQTPTDIHGRSQGVIQKLIIQMCDETCFMQISMKFYSHYVITCRH